MVGRTPDVFVWDDFRLDLDRYRLERAGDELALEPKALNLLALLVSRPVAVVDGSVTASVASPAVEMTVAVMLAS